MPSKRKRTAAAAAEPAKKKATRSTRGSARASARKTTRSTRSSRRGKKVEEGEAYEYDRIKRWWTEGDGECEEGGKGGGEAEVDHR